MNTKYTFNADLFSQGDGEHFSNRKKIYILTFRILCHLYYLSILTCSFTWLFLNDSKVYFLNVESKNLN